MLLKQEREEKKLDPRIKRTRQSLQQALLALMAEKSFQAITVQDIAERATVNRVTFYSHFEDKDALLEYTMREMFHQRLRGQLPEGTPFKPDNLEQLMATVCEFLAEMNGQCPPPHRQFEPVMEKQIKAELYAVLLAWLSEAPPRLVGPRTTPELAAMFTSWGIYGAAAQWSHQDHPESVHDFVQQTLPLVTASLMTFVDPSPLRHRLRVEASG